MRYEVMLTTQAMEHLKSTMEYIAEVLLSPETARKWAYILKDEIARLDFLPTRYPLTEEEPWRTKGIHIMPVKNFLVYYWIDEEQATVWITAIIYGRRDQLQALREI